MSCWKIMILKCSHLNVEAGALVCRSVAKPAKLERLEAKPHSEGGCRKKASNSFFEPRQRRLVLPDSYTSLGSDKKQLLGFDVQQSVSMWSILPHICNIPIAHIARLPVCVSVCEATLHCMWACTLDNRGLFEPGYRGLPMRLRQSNYGNHPCARSTSRLKPELLRSGQQTAGRIRHSTGTLTGANELREGSSGEKMRRTHSLYSSTHTFTLCGHISAFMHSRSFLMFLHTEPKVWF